MTHKKLSSEDSSLIVSLYKQGQGASKIAKQFSVSKTAIYYVLNRSGLGTRPQNNRVRGLCRIRGRAKPRPHKTRRLYAVAKLHPIDQGTAGPKALGAGAPHRITHRGSIVSGQVFGGKYLFVECSPEVFNEDVLNDAAGAKIAASFWPGAASILADQGLQLLLAMPGDRRSGWLNRIESLTASSDKRVGARECVVQRIATSDARIFYEENHIQGAQNSGLHYGLLSQGHLTALMTFSSPGVNRARGADLLLARFAVCGHVPGAASRLLAAARREHPGRSILTFSDNRYSNGGVYRAIGFMEAGHVTPSYRYIRGGRVFAKESLQRKHLRLELGRSPGSEETEAQMARLAGYQRLYDAGKIRWLCSTSTLGSIPS